MVHCVFNIMTHSHHTGILASTQADVGGVVIIIFLSSSQVLFPIDFIVH